MCARSRPVSAGAAATHVRPPRARAAARVLRGAQRALPRAAGALLPVRLLAAAADLAAGFAACLPCRAQVAGSVFLRVPRGAILLPVMAGGAWRGNSAVYVGAFCGSEEEGCQAPFQGCAEAGYRAKQDMRKPDLCIDRARSIHKLIPVPRTCRKFPGGKLRRRVRGPFAELEQQGCDMARQSSMQAGRGEAAAVTAARGSRPSAAVAWVLADRRGVRAAGSGGRQSRAGPARPRGRGALTAVQGRSMEQDTAVP